MASAPTAPAPSAKAPVRSAPVPMGRASWARLLAAPRAFRSEKVAVYPPSRSPLRQRSRFAQPRGRSRTIMPKSSFVGRAATVASASRRTALLPSERLLATGRDESALALAGVVDPEVALRQRHHHRELGGGDALAVLLGWRVVVRRLVGQEHEADPVGGPALAGRPVVLQEDEHVERLVRLGPRLLVGVDEPRAVAVHHEAGHRSLLLELGERAAEVPARAEVARDRVAAEAGQRAEGRRPPE